LAAAIRLYLEECLTSKIARQLQRKGIDIVTVQELGVLGNTDENHLARATALGRVLVTSDVDYLVIAASKTHHAGIVFGVQEGHGVGDWVRALELLCAVYDPDDMKNHVEYL
jgi:hypothetical protein